jgi:hypothetical protein
VIYTVAIYAHSWIRWAVLLAVVGRVGLALADRRSGRAYDKRARVASAITVGLLDLNLVLGLMLLFWLSPLTTSAMADMGGAMGDPLRRFWLVEHPFAMMVSVTVAHVASVLGRKQADPTRAHTYVALGLALALLVMMTAIPWPGREIVGRPLFAL